MENKNLTLSDGTIMFQPVKIILKPGTVIPFGPCAWRILDISDDDSTMLVIAENNLEEMKFRKVFAENNWETSTIRQWLNGEYPAKLPSELKESILVTTVINPENPEYHTPGGIPTKDRVFLLSIEEAERYLIKEEERVIGGGWWLRSPGGYHDYAACINQYGIIDRRGQEAALSTGLVRPAFRLNLESGVFPSLIRKEENGALSFSWYALSEKDGILKAAYNGLKEVHFPEEVREIAPRAFSGCGELESISWEGKMPRIGADSFVYCPKLRFPVAFFRDTETLDPAFLSWFPEKDPGALAGVLFHLGPERVYSPRLENFVRERSRRLTPEEAEAVVKELTKLLKNGSPGDAGFPFRFAVGAADMVSPETLTGFMKCLEGGPDKNIRWFYREIRKNHNPESGFCMDAYKLDSSILFGGGTIPDKLPAFSRILKAVSGYAEQYRNSRIVYSEYNPQASWYKKDQAAEEAAAGMDQKALMKLLAGWFELSVEYFAPYAAFAGEKQLKALIREAETGRRVSPTVFREHRFRMRGAILLNDSAAAAIYAESINLMDQYAKIRGKSAEEIRSEYLYATLKEPPSKMAELEKKVLFERFLSGSGMSFTQWQERYQKHPVFRKLAMLIVWEQGKKTFILDKNGNPADEAGHPVKCSARYTIRVAHPMEMGPVRTAAWQKYFRDRELKQPFPQVWEPAEDKKRVRPDRYAGSWFPLSTFKDKVSHGIILEGNGRLKLRDCTADLRKAAGPGKNTDNRFEVSNFRFKRYTRLVNHIVSIFDRDNIRGRILRDDVTVAREFSRITGEEIEAFIDLALQNHCPNVTAALLAWKQEHRGAEGETFNGDGFELDDL